MSNWGLILFMVLMFGFIWFFYRITLTTKIDSTGVYVNLYPFGKKLLQWEDIETIQFIKYNPFFTGGFGLKYSFTYGTVYNIKGNKGILVSLKGGKKILIGTQKTNELKKLFR